MSPWTCDPAEGDRSDPAASARVLAWTHFVGRGDKEALTPHTACVPGRQASHIPNPLCLSLQLCLASLTRP